MAKAKRPSLKELHELHNATQAYLKEALWRVTVQGRQPVSGETLEAFAKLRAAHQSGLDRVLRHYSDWVRAHVGFYATPDEVIV